MAMSGQSVTAGEAWSKINLDRTGTLEIYNNTGAIHVRLNDDNETTYNVLVGTEDTGQGLVRHGVSTFRVRRAGGADVTFNWYARG
jgi:hypothetical protein